MPSIRREIFEMPNIIVDACRIRPIAFDGDKAEPLLDDQFARDALTHPIEFRGPMRRLAEQHDARVAHPFEQRAKIDFVDRAEMARPRRQCF